MKFSDFVINYNIIGVSLGTIVGFGLTNFVKEFRNAVIIPVIKDRLNITENYGKLTSALIEIIILITLIYLVYSYILTPVLGANFKKKEESKDDEKEWREKLLKAIEDVSETNYDISDNMQNLNDKVDNSVTAFPSYS